MKRMQRDTLDLRAQALVPTLVAAARGASDTDGLSQYVDALDSWNYRMERDSLAALVFARWFDQYREATFGPEFRSAGLDESYYPADWVLQHLDSGSRWFGTDSRATVMVRALRQAVRGIENEGEQRYGDYNTTEAMNHPLGLDFLGYLSYPPDGSRATVNNYAVENPTGSSWRMVVPMAGDSRAILPGGNAGAYFSTHYDDQLRLWADGEYKSMSRELRGTPTYTFEHGGQQ